LKRIKLSLKKIPLVGDFFVKIHAAVKRKPSAVQGDRNTVKNNGFFHHVVLDIIGNDNYIEIGKNTQVKKALIYIRGNNHRLIMEDNCYFGGGELWIEDNNCQLIIHESTTVEEAHLAVTEPFSVLEIHKDCMLAKYVEIRTGDSHSILDKETGRRINKAANVCIGEHVWVGAHAKILKGVTIGNNSVIGTASVVTKDVPECSIASGVPAKVIRTGINWDRKRIYN
jgi:acetyltransferase-like isoleucine patch superfamily enzyme